MLVTDGYWHEDNPARPSGFFGVQDSHAGDAAGRHRVQPLRHAVARDLERPGLAEWRARPIPVARTVTRRSPTSRSSTGRRTSHRSCQQRPAVPSGQDDRRHRIAARASRRQCVCRTRKSTTTRRTIRRAGSTSCSSWSRSASRATALLERRGLRRSEHRSLQAAQGPAELGRHHRLADSRAQRAESDRRHLACGDQQPRLVLQRVEPDRARPAPDRRDQQYPVAARLLDGAFGDDVDADRGHARLLGRLRHERLLGLPDQAGSRSGRPESPVRRSGTRAASSRAAPSAAGVCTMPPGAPPNVSSRRTIFTSNATEPGTSFRWSSLSGQQQNALNQDPNSTLVLRRRPIRPGCDGNGQFRVDWVRGVRTHEIDAAAASPSQLRARRDHQLAAGLRLGADRRLHRQLPARARRRPSRRTRRQGLPGAGSYAQFVYNNKIARRPSMSVRTTACCTRSTASTASSAGRTCRAS